MAFSRATINFVVNAQAARQQILAFKNSISQAGRDLSNTFIGKFGALAGLGGGIKALTDTYKHVKRLSDFASSFNLPVEQVSKFTNTMGLFGASAEDSLSALQSVQQAIIDFRTTGGGALKTVAAQVGLSLMNADGSMKNSMQVIEDLRHKFKGLSQSAQVKVAQELGLSNPAILRMLRATDKEYAEMKKKGSDMNVVNQRMADNVQRLNRALEKAKMTWLAIGAVILDKVLPYIEKAVDWFNEFNNLSDDTKDIIIKVVGGFMALKPAIGIITTLKDVITLLAAPLKAVLALIVANPILATIAAIALGIIYLDEIKAKWNEFIASGTAFSKFCKSVVDDLMLVLKPFELLGQGIGWVAAKIGSWNEKKEIDAKQEALKALPSESEMEAARQGKLTASNEALSNSINNSVLTTNGDTNNSNVYNTFNFNGTNDDFNEQMQRIVRQNTTGVVR